MQLLKQLKVKIMNGKIYEVGGPKIISFGDMVKSIMKTLIKKDLLLKCRCQ